MKTRILQTLSLAAVIALLPMLAFAQQKPLQYFRPYSSEGLNVFETSKVDDTPFTGLNVFWGAAFTQQFQSLSHENSGAAPLLDIGSGFNLATANLMLGAQLADGIQVNLVTYLSSRHHSESWVKGGYMQVDKLTMLNSEAINNLMEYVTLRVGHMEINYGDAHFRRTDNGMALFNPFVGNLIMDSFATEIGAEVMVQNNGLFGMVAMTGGEIKGRVDLPDDRTPSIYGKVGFDRQLNEDLRVRLSGSVYTTSKAISNTLFAGDRAGSRFYDVLVEKSGDDFRNGRINPGFNNKITAIQINPFIKFQDFELHGVYETATGEKTGQTERTFDQIAVDAIYRFGDVFLGARYNTVSGELASGEDVTVDRIQVGGGWFLTPNVLMKATYVSQNYNDYPTGIYENGKFNGVTIEGVIAF
jgi:hypothetical protein